MKLPPALLGNYDRQTDRPDQLTDRLSIVVLNRVCLPPNLRNPKVNAVTAEFGGQRRYDQEDRGFQIKPFRHGEPLKAGSWMEVYFILKCLSLYLKVRIQFLPKETPVC